MLQNQGEVIGFDLYAGWFSLKKSYICPVLASFAHFIFIYQSLVLMGGKKASSRRCDANKKQIIKEKRMGKRYKEGRPQPADLKWTKKEFD